MSLQNLWNSPNVFSASVSQTAQLSIPAGLNINNNSNSKFLISRFLAK